MKLAVLELVTLFVSLFIAFIILGIDGAIISALISMFVVILLIIITIAVKNIILKNKELSFLVEYLILILVLFLFLFNLFELGGIQSVISLFYGGFISFVLILILNVAAEILKVETNLTKKKNLKILNKIIFEEKEIAVLAFIVFLLPLTLFAAFVFVGIKSNKYYFLIPLLFFLMGLVLFYVLDRKFYNKKKTTLLNNFEKLFEKQKKIFSILIFVLLISFLIVTSLSFVNEYYFSINSKPVNIKQIGDVELMPYPNGAKTVVIFTNDDAGLKELTTPDEFRKIVDLHIKHNISGTFFVIASALNDNQWLDVIKYAISNNQNIEFHSYSHKLFEYGSIYYFINYPNYEKQNEIFTKSMKIFDEKLGFKPTGFRPTIWASNKDTLLVLSDENFEYISDRTLLFTPRVPYYHAADGKVSDILTIPASLELNFVFGPKIIKQFLLEFNKYMIYYTIERHKDNNIPFVFVTHTGRFKDEYSLQSLNQVMEFVKNDSDVVVMNMKEYNDWIRLYEKVSVDISDNVIKLNNGFPGLVVEQNGVRYAVNSYGTIEIKPYTDI
ncbi:MAG: DUF2334 domain-containing protein [Nanoarchaeota archaeon]